MTWILLFFMSIYVDLILNANEVRIIEILESIFILKLILKYNLKNTSYVKKFHSNNAINNTCTNL